MTFNFDAIEDVLKCPQSKSDLVVDGESLVCVDADCRLRFEIRDDIPVMLVDDATELSADQWAQVMHAHGRETNSQQPRGE